MKKGSKKVTKKAMFTQRKKASAKNTKVKIFSNSKITKLRALIVILLIANIGVWQLVRSHAAPIAQVRFVYYYAADQAQDNSKYAQMVQAATDIPAFYKSQVGKSLNVGDVGASYKGSLTVAQMRTCPVASCANGAQGAIYQNLSRDSRIRVPGIETMVITQFNMGSPINCGMGDYDPNGTSLATGLIVYATADCQTYGRTRATAAHELGHGFGLSKYPGGGGHSADHSLMDANAGTTSCDSNWGACFLDSYDKAYLQNSPFFASPPHWTLTSDDTNPLSPSVSSGSLSGQMITIPRNTNFSWHLKVKNNGPSTATFDEHINSYHYNSAWTLISSSQVDLHNGMVLGAGAQYIYSAPATVPSTAVSTDKYCHQIYYSNASGPGTGGAVGKQTCVIVK